MQVCILEVHKRWLWKSKNVGRLEGALDMADAIFSSSAKDPLASVFTNPTSVSCCLGCKCRVPVKTVTLPIEEPRDCRNALDARRTPRPPSILVRVVSTSGFLLLKHACVCQLLQHQRPSDRGGCRVESTRGYSRKSYLMYFLQTSKESPSILRG